ncbi:hypothetical protein TCDM_12285 [Trypanosoma cruzi Dm28c]|uniref:Uncharacterized protein n=1 Tax=Trypanosoma cruzi Dm28c TaxID=1416333 RepID=V5AVD7_TRYCR|nr:hypothetical protein TCDM_12285 [Trypanosoma cruzi Dm28c]
MADGDPSPCKQVDVQWDTRSTRCAVTSGNKTRRPLIRAAYAGSSDSSDSMPIGVAARFSPAAVEGEQPSRSSWCRFRSPAMGAAEPERRMVLARCETWAIDDGELQRFTGNMMGQASGHTRKAVVSTQLVPAATGAHTARCGAPRGPRHRHAHCRPGGIHCSQRASSPRAFLHSTVQVPVCVLQDLERGGAQGGTSAQQEAQLDGSGKCGTVPTSTITHGGSTHPSTKQKKKMKKKHGGRVWLCVRRCGCLPALDA